jgi:hypothetical protein
VWHPKRISEGSSSSYIGYNQAFEQVGLCCCCLLVYALAQVCLSIATQQRHSHSYIGYNQALKQVCGLCKFAATASWCMH